MRILIEVEVEADEDIDTSHAMGITNHAYEMLTTVLGNKGFAVQDITRADDE